MSLPDSSAFADVIHRFCPEIAIDRVQLNQEGQYNDVVIVNDELIFRFPKFVEGIAALKRETTILSRLQGQITLAIPNPIVLQLQTETVGEAFMGYRLLPGRPLWQENFHAIHDATALERMAHQLAGFLRELHTIPVTHFQEIDLLVADQVPEWVNLYERIQQKLYPLMSADAREEVTAHFEGYLAHPDLYDFVPVLRHGDFGTGNLLYDPATLSITGVIDFSAATLGDPAIDFAGLLSFGEGFCRHCYAAYPELEGMRERVNFYQGTFALQEALYGFETGDIQALTSGMERYK